MWTLKTEMRIQGMIGAQKKKSGDADSVSVTDSFSYCLVKAGREPVQKVAMAHGLNNHLPHV